MNWQTGFQVPRQTIKDLESISKMPYRVAVPVNGTGFFNVGREKPIGNVAFYWLLQKLMITSIPLIE